MKQMIVVDLRPHCVVCKAKYVSEKCSRCRKPLCERCKAEDNLCTECVKQVFEASR